MSTSLEVDKELKPTVVRRTLDVRDGVLHVYVISMHRASLGVSGVTHLVAIGCALVLFTRTYEALDVRMLRTVVSSFFDMLFLVIETIKTFA